MRNFIYALLVLTAGCEATVPAQRDAGLSWCTSECGTCGTGESCVTWTVVESWAACLRRCTTTADCAGGARCVEIDPVFGASPAGRFCVPDEGCPGHSVMCTPRSQSACRDTTTLERHFANLTLCGREMVGCANGCDPSAAPDAGAIPDNARCR